MCNNAYFCILYFIFLTQIKILKGYFCMLFVANNDFFKELSPFLARKLTIGDSMTYFLIT